MGRTIWSWLGPLAGGAAVGYALAHIYLELFNVASGWWGAGNTSLGLLVFGPLEIVDLYLNWLPPRRVIGPLCGVPLYATQALLLWRAKEGARHRTLGAIAYLSWSVLSIAAAVFHGSRLGFSVFFKIEGGGLQMFAKHAPGWTVTLGTFLLAWHAFAWWCLLRQGGRRLDRP